MCYNSTMDILKRNTCKYCGCTDYKACLGGCFWIDEEKEICSSCAIDRQFRNRDTGNVVKVTGQMISSSVVALQINSRYYIEADEFKDRFEIKNKKEK